MLTIPALVQHLASPLVIAVGRLLGEYAKHTDVSAPLPMRSLGVAGR